MEDEEDSLMTKPNTEGTRTLILIILLYRCHHHHHHHLLSQVSFPLVLLLLNEWCAPPLRLHVSDDSNFLIISDVPSRAVFVNNLLNAFLVLFPDFF